ncbi:MAG: peptidyl-prolyl cis-trans isomerase [Myxococcales bacterium]|nr:peptidyl-prolyl cis-trans isomerase [Myxococcales bacterium]
MFRAALREPLLHFAGLGLLLFALFRILHGAGEDLREIVVSSATRSRIESAQERRLGRPPSPAELDAALQEWADAELLYREARALGLDRGDPIVRRRLVQKMQFLLEEERELPEPDDEALAAWIEANAARFQQAPRLQFTHVFVAGPTPAPPEAELAILEQALAEGADPATLGQAHALGQEIGPKTADELARGFGADFAEAALALADDGRWHRLRSIHGWHLVHVDERSPGRLATVDEVRSQAREGLRREARETAREQAMAELRERYNIRIDEEGEE